MEILRPIELNYPKSHRADKMVVINLTKTDKQTLTAITENPMGNCTNAKR